MYMFLTSYEPYEPIVFRDVYHLKLFSYFGHAFTKRLGVKKYLCVESMCECIVIFVF